MGLGALKIRLAGVCKNDRRSDYRIQIQTHGICKGLVGMKNDSVNGMLYV